MSFVSSLIENSSSQRTRSSTLAKTCLYCGLTSGDQDYCCEACQRLHQGTQVFEDFRADSAEQFSYYDQPEIAKTFETHKGHLNDGQDSQYVFFVEGLQCSSCVHLIEKISDYYPECASSRINFGTAELTVELKSTGKLSVVASLLEQLGYKSRLINPEESVFEKIKADNRKDLLRIAVAGASAGNIMIFAFSLYAGVTGQLAEVFRWLNLILFLPILFYSAIPFYKAAWNSLKYRTIHIDLPIVIALWAGTVLSAYNLIVGSDDFYFDSTASFIFLILVARFLVKRTQQKFLSPYDTPTAIRDQIYTRKDGSRVMGEFILEGDVLVLSRGQIVPVDGILLSSAASIDTSFMSGESVPLKFTKDLPVYAGYRTLSDETVVLCEKRLRKSRISELIHHSLQNTLTKSHYLNLADRLSQKLLLVVFTIAAVFFIVYGFVGGFKESFDRALALIVVACPCALAFGSPLTLAIGFKKAQEKGIAIRNPDVFEKLDRVENVFFDKTGTLTYGKLSISEDPQMAADQNVRDLILNLERISSHPIAFAFREAWIEPQERILFTEHQEILGQGVKGIWNGDLYEIKSLAESIHDHDVAVALYKNNQIIQRFYLRDQMRPESAQLIADFEAKKINCFLLTGDRKFKAEKVATAVGISPDHVYSQLFPEDKEKIIKNFQHTIMIGDGVNDTLALSRSDVGIAVKGSSELSLTSSDVFFMAGGLRPLWSLFEVRGQISETLYRNLFLSLLYNTIAGGLALIGLVNPLMAAILMPMSTAVVVASTLWGFRK